MYNNGLTKLSKVDLGLTAYKEAWELQKKLVNLRWQGKVTDLLLLTEHEPVITMGRAAYDSNLLIPKTELKKLNIGLYQVERGGDVTFHGPGQVLAYPIIDLNNRGRDLHKYLRDLEAVVMDVLEQLGLPANTRRGMTGVWVNNHKLAAIGVAVSQWITYHGLALNVETDLDYFRLINPCGITQFPVGSVSSMLGKKVKAKQVAHMLAASFVRLFGYETETSVDISELLEEDAVV